MVLPSELSAIPGLPHLVIGALSSQNRCIAYDQRGWGLSGAPQSGFMIGDLARDVSAVTAALGLDDYVLIGHSMGGKVAQVVAAARPPGLVGLILVAPAPARPASTLGPDAQKQLLDAYETQDSVRNAVEAALTHHTPSDEAIADIVRDSLSGTVEATRAWPTRAIDEDVSAGVQDINVPTLVVGGEHDHVEPVTLLAEHVLPLIPTARLEVVADSGHLIPLEKPQELAELIAGFLASLEPR